MDNQNPTVRALASSVASPSSSIVEEILDVSTLPGCSLGVGIDQVEGTLLGFSSSSLDTSADEAHSIPNDEISAGEVFDMIRDIKDPEHPLTLEQLSVVDMEHVSVDDAGRRVSVEFTPTVPHCSMSTLIGLSLRVKLLRSLPQRLKVRVSIVPGTHVSDAAITKQINDKERVAAALENTHLVNVVNQCIRGV